MYCNASGAKINKNKSEVILFQSDNNPPPFDLKDYTLKRYTKYLGIMIGHDIPSNLIWDPVLNTMKAMTSLWKKRNTSIQGRVLVTKALISSRLWYIAYNQIIPEAVFKEIQEIIYEFIWQGKRAPVNHVIASRKKKDGGLNVLSVESQIQALLSKWIVQWFSPEPRKWKTIVTWWLEESTKKFNLNLGMNMFKTDKYIPGIKLPSPFWNEVLKVWGKLNITRIFSPEKRIDILNEPILQNPLIRLANGQVIKYISLLKCGIYTIQDLMIGDRFPMIGELGHFSDQKGIQKKIIEVISCLKEEWLEVLRFRDTDSGKEIGQSSTNTPTPMSRQFGFIDNQQNKIMLVKMTVKRAYICLIQRKHPSPHLKIESRWEILWEIGQLLWDLIWDSCHNVAIMNKKKELSWRILHQAIPTKSHVSKYNHEVSPFCLFCKEGIETIRHLWYSCSNAQFLWSWFKQLINYGNAIEDEEITVNEFTVITNGYDLGIKSEFKKEQWRILLSEIKWQIWLARNEALWNNKDTITTTKLLMIIKNVFKEQIEEFTNHRRKKGISVENEQEMVKEIMEALKQSSTEALRLRLENCI
jgi:hypothetical protein